MQDAKLAHQRLGDIVNLKVDGVIDINSLPLLCLWSSSYNSCSPFYLHRKTTLFHPLTLVSHAVCLTHWQQTQANRGLNYASEIVPIALALLVKHENTSC